MKSMDKAAVLLATGFYAGRAPHAPGTVGTLVALPFCFALAKLDTLWAGAVLVLFVVAAIRVAGRAEVLLGRKDAPGIVIDEMAGMMIGLAGLPFTLETAVVGFAAFRIFDILKPFPARRIDTRMSGGLGIVLDDVVAGVYTNLLVRVLVAVLTVL
jgi:phosphatidylglycerophosphatase A